MFTNDEIAILLEALDEYQKAPLNDGFSSMILGAMLAPAEAREQLKADSHRQMDEAKLEMNRREETVILLKAKLIQMRNRTTVDEMAHILKNG